MRPGRVAFALLLPVLFLGGVALGGSGDEPPPVAGAGADLNSAAGMLGLLPKPGSGSVLAVRPHVPADGVDEGPWPLPAELCLPGGLGTPPTRSSPAAADLELRGAGPVRVRFVRLAEAGIADTAAALRGAAETCEQQVFGADVVGDRYYRMRGPVFGDATAIYRGLGRVRLDGEPAVIARSGTTLHAVQGEWLVAVHADSGPDEELFAAAREVLGSFDATARTTFLAPRPAPEGPVGCAGAASRVEDLPDPGAAQPAEFVEALHDVACAREVLDVRDLTSDPFLADGGVVPVDREPVPPDALGDLARALEGRATTVDGLIRYRAGESAALFDFPRGAAAPRFTGFVRDCAHAVPAALPVCAPGPPRGLGDVDWPALIGKSWCPDELPVEPSVAYRGDLTGDGLDDAVVLVSCTAPTSGMPDEVRVYAGTAAENSPRLLGIPLGPRDGTDERGLFVDSVDLLDGVLVVTSFGYGPGDPNADPGFVVTDRFRWNGGTFDRGARDVEPAR
ncbi:hypothetical protein ABZ805_09630 [Saccharopolyspora sp. NPDC047091]|uniref:hypothetical protein n=1 Tax=Saccharopolyspora sp. NPDC047091 TaxID=3155924 RepID=UPI0033E22873